MFPICHVITFISATLAVTTVYKRYQNKYLFAVKLHPDYLSIHKNYCKLHVLVNSLARLRAILRKTSLGVTRQVSYFNIKFMR